MKHWIAALGATALAHLSLTAPAAAQEIVWGFEATYGPQEGGGTACGWFCVDASVGPDSPDNIVWWDIIVYGDATYADGDYYAGYVDHERFPDPVIAYFDDPSPADPSLGLRSFFVDVSALPLQEGLYTLPPGAIGEYLEDTVGAGSFRVFDGDVVLLGVLLSDFAEDDIYAEGGRLDEVAQAGDPVDLIDGAFTYSAVLLEGGGPFVPFQFEVFYDSRADDLTTGGVGVKWTHSYEWYLVSQESEFAQTLDVVRGDRATDYFRVEDTLQGIEILPSYPQSRTKLEFDGVRTLTYTDHRGVRYLFDNEQAEVIEGEDGPLYVARLTAVADRNGNVSTLVYDSFGFLTAVVGPAPEFRTATFSYDPGGCISEIDYESGLMRVRLDYDGQQNLRSFSSATNPALTTRFTYDGVGNLLSAAAVSGSNSDVFVRNQYDAQGRVISQLDAVGNETTFAYEELPPDPSGGSFRTTITDACGNVSTRTFDDQSRIVQATNSAGEEFTWCYDQDGNLCQSSGPLGTRSIEYSAGGNVSCLVDEAGGRVDLTWGDGVLTGIASGGAGALGYEYDDAGNLTRFTNEMGQSLSFEHDAQGRLMRTTDFLGRTFSNTYDPQTGALAMVQTPTGPVRRSYDAMGRLDSTTDQRGNTRSRTYDVSGALSSYTTASGEAFTITNDLFGRALRYEHSNGVSLDLQRDGKGRVTAASDAEGNRYRYAYDELGRFVSRRDPAGATTRFEHHPNGQMERVVDSMGGVASATFTAAGQKATVTDPNGNTTSYTYDEHGRTLSESDALGNTTLNEYDALGNLRRLVNARGQDLFLGYDAAGRVTQVTGPGYSASYTLDAAGRQVQATQDSIGASVTYDAASGLVASRTDHFGNTIRYAYDPVGNLTALTYSDGKTVSYTYDASDRMTSATDWNGRTTTYIYSGRTRQALLPDGSTVTWEFDACGRLERMTDVAAVGETTYSGEWLFDACGRTRKAIVTLPLEPDLAPEDTTIVYSAANRIESVNGNPFAYDADGNLTGGTIGGVPSTLAYDSQDRLVRHDGDAYVYDPDGFRIQVTRSGQTTRQVWDVTSADQRLLEEHDAAGNITRRYVYGIGLIAQEDAATGGVAVYHFDRRGSTVALTDETGTITDRYAYAPYGTCTNREGSTPNPFTYNGRDGVMDYGRGLYSTRTRDYIPSLGRFAQRESAYRGSLARPVTLNPYAFVDGNPIDAIDPSGRLWEWAAGAVGAGVGIVTGAGAQMIVNAIDGKPAFENVAGAAVAGAITGGALGLATGPSGLPLSAAIVAGGLGAAAGNAVNQGIALLQDKQDEFDLVDLGVDTALGAVAHGAWNKIKPKKLPSNGLKTLSDIGVYSLKQLGFRTAVKYSTDGDQTQPVRDYLTDDLFDDLGAVARAWDHDLSSPADWVLYPLGSLQVVAGALGRALETGALKPGGTTAGNWGMDELVPSAGEYLNYHVGGFQGVNLNADALLLRERR